MSGEVQAGSGAAAHPEADITARERQEVLGQIEEYVRQSRKPPARDLAGYRPRSSGVLLPILVNVVALWLIAAAVVGLPWLFNRSERTLTQRPRYLPTGEATIVGQVRKESEEQLAGKDRQIEGIQGQLDDLGKQIATLRAGRDAEIARREQELKQALAAELETEKKRLQQSGTGSVEKQLQAFQQQKQAELDQTLADFRKQKDAELAQQLKDYDARFALLLGDLDKARQERADLQGQLAQAQAGAAKAQTELAAARDRSAREQLALDQLTAAYQKVGEAMRAGRYDEAVASLDAVASYLAQPAVAGLPAIDRRRTVDAFLVDSLRRLAESEQGSPAVGSVQEAAALVEEAETKFGAGDVAAARQLYLSAIGRIPALKGAYDRLAQIDQGDAASSRQAVADALAEADAQYAKGNWKNAIDRYGRALTLLEEGAKGIGRAAARIADAGYRQGTADNAARQERAARQLVDKGETARRRGSLDEALASYASVLDSYPLATEQVKLAVAGIESVVDAKVQQKEDEIVAKDKALAEALARLKSDGEAAQKTRDAELARLKSMSDELSAAAKKAGSTVEAARKELIALLQAKVAVKEVLTSDAVKADHPGLSDSLDRYVELYGEQKRVEGRSGTLADVVAVADVLLGKKSQQDLAAVWARYAEETQRAAFQQVLDRLKLVLQ